MKTYQVYCGMRQASQFPAASPLSTIFRTVVVTAASVNEAASKAIDECYSQWGSSIEHVKPLNVREMQT